MSLQTVIEISTGSDTEGLIQAIIDEFKTEGLSEDAALDAIEIDREHSYAGGVANEPITIAATLAFATTLVVATARGIERWMENNHQRDVLTLLIKTQGEGANIKPLVDLAKKYAEVSKSQGLPNLSAGRAKAADHHPPKKKG
jgi:hypothetical protein